MTREQIEQAAKDRLWRVVNLNREYIDSMMKEWTVETFLPEVTDEIVQQINAALEEAAIECTKHECNSNRGTDALCHAEVDAQSIRALKVKE